MSVYVQKDSVSSLPVLLQQQSGRSGYWVRRPWETVAAVAGNNYRVGAIEIYKGMRWTWATRGDAGWTYYTDASGGVWADITGGTPSADDKSHVVVDVQPTDTVYAEIAIPAGTERIDLYLRRQSGSGIIQVLIDGSTGYIAASQGDDVDADGKYDCYLASGGGLHAWINVAKNLSLPGGGTLRVKLTGDKNASSSGDRLYFAGAKFTYADATSVPTDADWAIAASREYFVEGGGQEDMIVQVDDQGGSPVQTGGGHGHEGGATLSVDIDGDAGAGFAALGAGGIASGTTITVGFSSSIYDAADDHAVGTRAITFTATGSTLRRQSSFTAVADITVGTASYYWMQASGTPRGESGDGADLMDFGEGALAVWLGNTYTSFANYCGPTAATGGCRFWRTDGVFLTVAVDNIGNHKGFVGIADAVTERKFYAVFDAADAGNKATAWSVSADVTVTYSYGLPALTRPTILVPYTLTLDDEIVAILQDAGAILKLNNTVYLQGKTLRNCTLTSYRDSAVGEGVTDQVTGGVFTPLTGPVSGDWSGFSGSGSIQDCRIKYPSGAWSGDR